MHFLPNIALLYYINALLAWELSKALWLCLPHGRCGAGNEHRQCTLTAALALLMAALPSSLRWSFGVVLWEICTLG